MTTLFGCAGRWRAILILMFGIGRHTVVVITSSSSIGCSNRLGRTSRGSTTGGSSMGVMPASKLLDLLLIELVLFLLLLETRLYCVQ